MASSNYTPSGGRQELMTIRESEEGGTTITDTMGVYDLNYKLHIGRPVTWAGSTICEALGYLGSEAPSPWAIRPPPFTKAHPR